MINGATDELVTVRDWLRWAVSRFNEAGLFFGHGTDNAWDEAVWLVLATLHLPRDTLEPWLDARLTKNERLTPAGTTCSSAWCIACRPPTWCTKPGSATTASMSTSA
jgi:hypothetical protein